MQLNHQQKISVPIPSELVKIKAELLSCGLSLANELYENFGPPYLEKRRGYGNQDPLELRNKTIPQEIYLGSPSIVAAINVRHSSPWILTHEDDNFLVSNKSDDRKIKVSFPLRPNFYDKKISSGQNVNQIITLYGGKSLAIFVYGTCSLVAIGKPCHYCSIDPNRTKPNDFEQVVKPWQLEEALKQALEDCPPEVNQVMINGGNFPDLDKSFTYYAELAQVADKVIKDMGKPIDLHLIVFPPQNLELLNLLKDTSVGIAMNTEVFDPLLFEKYCPGKTNTLGQENLFKALKKAVNVLGEGRVFSILVGGLEPHESLKKGLDFLANKGVTPVVNVFHPDPQTPLEAFPAPQPEEILRMGKALQETFSTNSFMTPFYKDCGRNSLDNEAYMNLFY